MGVGEDEARRWYVRPWRWIRAELIDAGQDVATADPFVLRQVRVVSICTLGIVAIGVPFVAQYAWLGVPRMSAAVAAAVALGCASFAVLRATGRAALCGVLSTTTLFALLLFSNSASGGFYDPNLSWLYVVPIVAGLTAGRRASLVFTGLSVSAVGVFWVLAEQGVAVPDLVPPERHALQSLANRISAMLAIQVLVWAFLFERNRADRRLRQTVAELEQASQAKNELLARVSHELRTPLNAVLGQAGLLLDGALAEEQRQRVASIQRAGETLLEQVGELLLYSRLDAGRQGLSPTAFDPCELLEDICELFAEEAERRGLLLTWLPGPDLPGAVVADRPRLKQVLANLLGNALKFTEQGSVVVRLEVTEPVADPPRRELRFVVRDTGPGISGALQERMFEPFAQGEESVARRFGGVGLGLSIARNLVRLMGGEIDLVSASGAGSTFCVRLPVTIVDAPVERPVDGPRCLVVAPPGPLRDHLLGQLERLGAAAETSDGAADARGRLTDGSAPPDWVVIDAGADGHGLELARTLPPGAARLLVGPPRLTVGRDALDAAGVAALVPRPVRLETLRRWLIPAAVTRTPSRPRAAPARLGGAVLVVEDNATNLAVLVAQLRSLGCEPSVARDGREALAVLADRPIDLVLMDCEMPVMDGLATTRELRRRWGARPPVVALTAHALDQVKRACLEAGMDDFLTKPVSPEVLAGVLARWLPPLPARASGDRAATSLTLDESQFGRVAALWPDRPAGVLPPVYAEFLASSRTRLVELGAALGRGDGTEVAALAHGLVGASGTLGATGMSALARRIERAAQDGDGQELAALIEALHAELQAFREAVEGL